jgi:hypothetical protein
MQSLPNPENCIIFEGPPPQDLTDARREGIFLDYYPIRLRGAPSGWGNHRTRWIMQQHSSIMPEYYDFHRKWFLKNVNARTGVASLRWV